ncbi:MAG: epoxyqueuosine reductase [Gemmatimonadota bacterium]|nr:MAG: epoxyqueuosine reductase [Gemmatimonadota bacterium]
MEKAAEQLTQSLAEGGFKSTILSTHRLADLKADFERLYEQGTFDNTFYNDRLSYYTFDIPEDFSEAQSIILIAAPQPKVKVTFEYSGTPYVTIVPPTYSYDTDKIALKSILQTLHTFGYRTRDPVLPVKSLAVRSGLASYGRNNMAYIGEWGSYFRLKAFLSDMPHAEDHWQNYCVMDRCNTCVACVKKCPTGAMSSERFVFHGEKCITYLNEGSNPFPAWVDPAWHNCLIGCMICQDVCPMNRHFVTWTIEDGEFSEDETSMILRGVPSTELPAVTREKLNTLDLLEEYESLGRNLRVLINGPQEEA